MSNPVNTAGVLIPDQRYTLEQAIREAAKAFDRHGLYFGHGTETALDEASWLILSAMDLSPLHPPEYQQILSADHVDACNRLLKRRITERLPAAYLTGRAWFAGHQLFCDSRALVPRSPLAEFISRDFYGVLASIDKPRVLDLCTGGGCIAVACAYALAESQIDASDLSADALALARRNVDFHNLQSRIRLLQGSLFEPISQRYDLIISNPPYVDAADMQSMPAEYHHEPRLGLEAGKDGLDLVHLMLEQAAHYLTEKGQLVVEVGNSESALQQAYPQLDFRWLTFNQGGMGVFLLQRSQLPNA